MRAGAPWRDVPPAYRPRPAAYGLLPRWQRDGTWARSLTGQHVLVAAAGLMTWEVAWIPRSPRGHQHAAGASKGGLQAGSPGGVRDEPADHGPGRCGGLTTEVQLACGQGQKLLAILITAGAARR